MDFIDSHLINLKESMVTPAAENTRCNTSYNFWKRALVQRIQSRIVFDNLPWSGDVKEFFYYVLLRRGYLAVFKNFKFGLAFQPCTLYGYNFYYQYTNAIISNPIFDADLTIGKECAIVKLTPDYMGVGDIVDFYATLLSNVTASVNVSIWNTRIPYLMYAKDSAGRKMLEKIYDRISEGNPSIFFENEVKMNGEESPIHIELLAEGSKNFISDKLINIMKQLLTMFDQEIGITDLQEKKERRIETEIETETIGCNARLDTWVDTLNSSLELVNEMYGLNIIAKKRSEVDGSTTS